MSGTPPWPTVAGRKGRTLEPALPRLRPHGAPAVLPNTLAVYLVAAFSNGG
jgi:hypothetical protein